MKRIFSILLLIAILFSCSACTEKAEKTVTYYYQTTELKLGTEQTVITPEIRDVKSSTNNYEDLIRTYLNGPTDESYVSPFPKNTALVSLEIGSTRAHVVLSSQLSSLSGHELTIACACIGKTVLEMTNARSVEIKSENSLLNGKQSIIISENDLVLWDNGAVETASSVD